MKKLITQVCPPMIIGFFRALKRKNVKIDGSDSQTNNSQQDLDVYWTKEMAEQLEIWGLENTWIEIECLLANCKGKVCDIACGTGVNIKELSKFSFLEVHGFDISDLLLEKAKLKGIDPKYLKLFDATKTGYEDSEFDYSYSIGSLEHFTEDGINLFLKECSRYTSNSAFHMIPVSENNINNGWMKRGQSYFNNSIEWWLPKFEKYFSKVYVLNSGWRDPGFSVGKWFICVK